MLSQDWDSALTWKFKIYRDYLKGENTTLLALFQFFLKCLIRHFFISEKLTYLANISNYQLGAPAQKWQQYSMQSHFDGFIKIRKSTLQRMHRCSIFLRDGFSYRGNVRSPAQEVKGIPSILYSYPWGQIYSIFCWHRGWLRKIDWASVMLTCLLRDTF